MKKLLSKIRGKGAVPSRVRSTSPRKQSKWCKTQDRERLEDERRGQKQMLDLLLPRPNRAVKDRPGQRTERSRHTETQRSRCSETCEHRSRRLRGSPRRLHGDDNAESELHCDPHPKCRSTTKSNSSLRGTSPGPQAAPAANKISLKRCNSSPSLLQVPGDDSDTEEEEEEDELSSMPARPVSLDRTRRHSPTRDTCGREAGKLPEIAEDDPSEVGKTTKSFKVDRRKLQSMHLYHNASVSSEPLTSHLGSFFQRDPHSKSKPARQSNASPLRKSPGRRDASPIADFASPRKKSPGRRDASPIGGFVALTSGAASEPLSDHLDSELEREPHPKSKSRSFFSPRRKSPGRRDASPVRDFVESEPHRALQSNVSPTRKSPGRRDASPARDFVEREPHRALRGLAAAPAVDQNASKRCTSSPPFLQVQGDDRAEEQDDKLPDGSARAVSLDRIRHHSPSLDPGGREAGKLAEIAGKLVEKKVHDPSEIVKPEVSEFDLLVERDLYQELMQLRKERIEALQLQKQNLQMRARLEKAGLLEEHEKFAS